MSIEWRDIPGYEGFYQVSNAGQVRSLDRTVSRNNGVPLPLKGKELQLGTSRGYLHVRLLGRTCKVHQLILRTFVGPRPDGMDVRHLNGDKRDNRLENLTYGTRSENCLDITRHGRNRNALKTHCPKGHEYTPENTVVKPSEGRRRCKACLTVAARRRWQKAAT